MTGDTMIVLLTGATGGIGKELCKEFAKDRHSLILVGREESSLKELSLELTKNYSIKTWSLCFDLRKPNVATEIFIRVRELNLSVDILVNMAGFGLYPDFLDRELILHQELLQVNILCLVELCHLFGEEMRRRQKGYIINFSSISGFFPGPYMSTYYASKNFVRSFSIALAKELEPYHVSVLALCPGVIHTPFYKKAEADFKHSYLLQRMKPNSPSTFAKKAYKVIRKNKKYYKVIGLKNKFLIFFSRFIPTNWIVKIIQWVQAKKIIF